MSDDFEKAILISFDFTGLDPNLKQQAASYISEIKTAPELWRLCLERFSVTAYPQVKFWCLQTLHEVIRASYGTFPAATKSTIRAAVLSWVTRDCNSSRTVFPVYLRNKVAQTLVAVLQFEYPGEWPRFFQELMGVMGQGEGVMDMFCRILVAVDEDLVSLDIPRSQDESKLSMHVKDSMREHSIADVAAAWYQLVEQYHTKNTELATMALQTMQRYISWIDIGLVANDKFISLLETLVLESPCGPLRGAAVDCLTEVVSKRMDAGPKLALIQQMNMVPLCQRLSSGFAVLATEDDELLLKCAKLLSTLAGEVMECLKRVENGVISMAAMGLSVDDEAAVEVNATTGLASKMLGQLLPAVLGAFQSNVDEVALPLLPFMSAYVTRLKAVAKRGQALPEEAALHLRSMLEGLVISARYPVPSENDFPGIAPSAAQLAAAKEEQTEVEEKRRELLTLYKNIAKLALTEALTFVGGLLQRITSQPSTPWQDVEVAVQLLYESGEGAPEEATRAGSGALSQLALALMQATLPAAQHRLVSLVVLETLVRYARVAQQQQQAMPNVLSVFLDARGMGHASEEVSTRACYLFHRLVKTVRSSLKPYIPTILQNLQPHLVRVATNPLVEAQVASTRDSPAKLGAPLNSLVDDRLYVFDSVGQLLGQDDLVDADEQLRLTSSLLQPLMQQIETNLKSRTEASPGLILQAMESVARLNKGYKPDVCTRTRPQIGAMFIKTLETALVVPRVFPGHKLLRTRFISLLHRLVECLQSTLLPYLPPALEVLVSTQADASDMTEVLALTNQLIVRFKGSLHALLDQLLPVLLARVHAALPAPPAWDWTGRTASPSALADGTAAGLSQDDARERGDLQRAYYSVMLTAGENGGLLGGSLLKAPPMVVDAALQGLTRGAAGHVDASVRKTCILIFSRLLSEWCAGGVEALPGFKRFAMESLGGQACCSGLLRSGLDARDAATVALLGEVATALKLVYAQCGDEFPAHLLAIELPALGCPAQLQQQLVYHIRESDAKTLKEFLRTLMLQNSQGAATAAAAAAAAVAGGLASRK